MADQIRFTPVQVFDANGDPVAGAKAYFYQTGTTTPLTTYADEGLTTPHPNPLVAVGNVFPAVFVSASVKAKVDVTDAADVRLNGYPIDPATIHTGGAGAGTISFSATAENPNTNVQDAIDAVSHPWTTAATEDLARAAMGVAIGTDVQAHDASLDDLAGITFSAGDILYHDGTNLVRLVKGTDGQFLRLASGIPSWAADDGPPTSLHAVGTHLWALATDPVLENATCAGSNLAGARLSSAGSTFTGGSTTPPGTWRALAEVNAGFAGLFVRVS